MPLGQSRSVTTYHIHFVRLEPPDPSKVIPNVLFEIKSVAGDYGPEEFRTDENGEIDLSKLPAGAYVVTELSCPGYVIDEAQRIIQLDPNEDFSFTEVIRILYALGGSRYENTRPNLCAGSHQSTA